VTSRDCKAIREGIVAVFPVHPFKLEAGKEDDFDKLLRRFEVDRDGDRAPDRFYLGPIVGTGGTKSEGTRYAAHLDTPFSIQVPTGEPGRQSWIEHNRVWSLHPDFINQLHSRIFNAFARRGFDDIEWFPDEDLDVLVRKARASIDKIQAEISALVSEKDLAVLSSAPSKVSGLETQIGAKTSTIEALEHRLAPYTSEQMRRRA
jgi:hypothetical protein